MPTTQHKYTAFINIVTMRYTIKITINYIRYEIFNKKM